MEGPAVAEMRCPIVEEESVLPVVGRRFSVRRGVLAVWLMGEEKLELEPYEVARCSMGHRHVLSMRVAE